MAVAVDTTLVGTASGNGVNSLTLSGFSTGGTNRLVLVASDESQDASTVASVTATGLTFSKVKSVNKGTSQGNVEFWGAWAAATQTSVAITVNFTGSNFPQCTARTIVLSGTDSTGTVAAAIGASSTYSSTATGSTVPTASLTTTRANSLVIACLGEDGLPSVTAGSNQTIDGTTQLAGQFSQVTTMHQNAITASSGTSVTMNATLGATTPVGLLAVEILAPTAATLAANKFIFPKAINRASNF